MAKVEFKNNNTTLSTGDYLVRFFDIDGTILKQEYVNTGNSATAPSNPNYDATYLVFSQWNQTFTNVQSDLEVGAIYDTIDGKSYLFVRITTTTGLQPTLQLQKYTSDLMTIDWGDGSTSTSSVNGALSITKTSAYSSIGDYLITIQCLGTYATSNSLGYLLGNNTTYSRILLKMYMHQNFGFNGSALINHSSLKIISISKDTQLSNGTFSGCKSIEHLNIPDGLTILNGPFTNMYSLKTISLPKSITSLYTPFGNCYKLEKFITPNATLTVGNFAMSGCYALKKFVISNSNTTFYAGAFYLDYGLEEPFIPSSLTTIENLAFDSCTSLKKLILPSTLTNIGSNGAFNNCTSILEYTFLSTTPPTMGAANAFGGINSACKIYVPDASVSAYQAATNWSTYANYIYPLSTKP